MRLSFSHIKVRWLRFAAVSIASFIILGVSIIMLLTLSNAALASQLNRSIRIFMQPHSHIASSPTILVSPTVPSNESTGSSQNSQDQQVISEAQHDVSTANTIIGFSGLFVAVVAVIVAIVSLAATVAGLFGVREVLRIRKSRSEIEVDVKRINELRTEIEEDIKRFDKFVEDFEEQLGKITQHTGDIEVKNQLFEVQLEKVTQHTGDIEAKSQRFEEKLVELAQRTDEFENKYKTLMEASYFFDLGTDAYKVGDNVRAIEHYKRALQLQPDNIKIMERLGRAYSNLNEMENAIKYLNDALKIDPENVPALRSLALCYRYSDKTKAIEYLKRSLDINPSGYEAWDFLGLLYRDQKRIDEAIAAHKEALTIKKRPETEFYLGILLLYSPKGDKIHAKSLILSAYEDTLEQEHDLRIRPVWKILIHAGVYIMDGKEEEALGHIQTLTQYITTQRIYEALKGHLEYLLEATDHKDWIPKFMEVVKLKEPSNVTA